MPIRVFFSPWERLHQRCSSKRNAAERITMTGPLITYGNQNGGEDSSQRLSRGIDLNNLCPSIRGSVRIAERFLAERSPDSARDVGIADGSKTKRLDTRPATVAGNLFQVDGSLAICIYFGRVQFPRTAETLDHY